MATKKKRKGFITAFSIIFILIFLLGALTYILPVAQFSGEEIINGSIVFTLDRELPSEWFQILSGGHLGSYSALMSYGPEKLKKNGRYAISMPVYASESPNSVKTIVENVLDWIPKANARYSAHVKSIAQQEQREREAARKAEIAKLERENELAAIIASLS